MCIRDRATNDQAYNKFLNGQCAAMLATGFCGPWEGMIQYWEEVNGSNYADAVKCLDLMPGVDGNAYYCCLLYTSDAADDLLCVDLGGRRILKKKKTTFYLSLMCVLLLLSIAETKRY